MNWQHLIYFHKLVETENFTIAARDLFITTSTLSRAIHNLEAELGFSLFEKRGRNSILTRYGREFDAYVVTALAGIQTGIETIRSQIGLIKGCIRLTGNWTMLNGFIPEQIKLFNHTYPEVTYITKFMLTHEILDAVINGEYELGFCGDFVYQGDYEFVERKLLYQEDIVLIVPMDHPFAREGVVDWTTVGNQTFVSFKSMNTGGLYEAFMYLCTKYNVRPQIGFEAQDDHVILSLVRQGMGIALMPDSKWLSLDGVRVLRISKEYPKRNQYMIWRKNSYLSPVSKAFRDFIIENSGNLR